MFSARGLIIGAAIAFGAPASAATLLTSAVGYAGPVLDLSSFGNDVQYTSIAAPILLPGGITVTADQTVSVIGRDPASGYGLAGNGQILSSTIVGTNAEDTVVTFRFTVPVSRFGLNLNYAPIDDVFPIIRAFDSNGTLLGSFDLSSLAPISTPLVLDAFAFRGIDGDGTGIDRFEMQGSYLVAAGQMTVTNTVPEPAAWLTMLTGFGILGSAMRVKARRALPAW